MLFFYLRVYFLSIPLWLLSGTSFGTWTANTSSSYNVNMQAIERGVVFEVMYAAAIRDSTMRRYTIANANVLMDICKGKVRLLPVSGHILPFKGRQCLKHLR